MVKAMKKYHIIVLIITTVVLSVIVPVIINECYKPNVGYITLWGAQDVLAYFGEILGALGSIFIGVIALAQSKQANKISDRLLQLEEKKNTPYLFIDITKSSVETFNNHEIDISIYLKNTTDNVISILGVNDLKMFPSLLEKSAFYVPFSTEWTKHYSVLPSQSRQINFFGEVPKRDEPLNNFEEHYINDTFLQMTCELTLRLGYVNSSDEFEQIYEFFLMIPKHIDKHTVAHFESIESSIIKIDTIENV